MGSVPPDENRYFVDADFDHGCDRVSMKSIKIPRCESRYSYRESDLVGSMLLLIT